MSGVKIKSVSELEGHIAPSPPPLKLAIRMLYSIVLIIIPVMVVIPKTF